MSDDRRLPWVKWYWSDWRGDERLRRCTLAARGLWADMLGIMAKAEPYGYLVIDGRQPSPRELAREVARPMAEVERALTELGLNLVFSRAADGTIYSRRMVRDRRARDRTRDRQDRHRARDGTASVTGTVTESVTEAVTASVTDSVTSRASRVPEARSQMPEARSQSESGALAPRASPLHSSHKHHVSCGRICVPETLHDDFVRRLGGGQDEADARLRRWYAGVHAEWEAKPEVVSEGAFVFWNARFVEWHPPVRVARAADPRTAGNEAAGARFVAKRQGRES